MATRRRDFTFKNICADNRPTRELYDVVVHVELTDIDGPKPSAYELPADHIYRRLSITADMIPHDVTAVADGAIYIGGQCLDTIFQIAYESPKHTRHAVRMRSNPTFQFLYDAWRASHRNDAYAGTPTQNEALGENCQADYDERIRILKEHDLVEDTLADGTPYRYGTGWLYEPIPERTLEHLDRMLS